MNEHSIEINRSMDSSHKVAQSDCRRFAIANCVMMNRLFLFACSMCLHVLLYVVIIESADILKLQLLVTTSVTSHVLSGACLVHQDLPEGYSESFCPTMIRILLGGSLAIQSTNHLFLIHCLMDAIVKLVQFVSIVGIDQPYANIIIILFIIEGFSVLLLMSQTNMGFRQCTISFKNLNPLRNSNYDSDDGSSLTLIPQVVDYVGKSISLMDYITDIIIISINWPKPIAKILLAFILLTNFIIMTSTFSYLLESDSDLDYEDQVVGSLLVSSHALYLGPFASLELPPTTSRSLRLAEAILESIPSLVATSILIKNTYGKLLSLTLSSLSIAYNLTLSLKAPNAFGDGLFTSSDE